MPWLLGEQAQEDVLELSLGERPAAMMSPAKPPLVHYRLQPASRSCRCLSAAQPAMDAASPRSLTRPARVSQTDIFSIVSKWAQAGQAVYNNALAESFFETLKAELVPGRVGRGGAPQRSRRRPRRVGGQWRSASSTSETWAPEGRPPACATFRTLATRWSGSTRTRGARRDASLPRAQQPVYHWLSKER